MRWWSRQRAFITPSLASKAMMGSASLRRFKMKVMFQWERWLLNVAVLLESRTRKNQKNKLGDIVQGNSEVERQSQFRN